MACLAICHDVEGGGDARSRLFAAHAAHNIANIGDFLFTGPMATADDVSGAGDDPRLRGSIYCLDIDDLSQARSVMESDPFMQGAWRQIDYYQWKDPAGLWVDVTTRPKGLKPDYRCYVAAFGTPTLVEGALMGGALAPWGSTGVVKHPVAAIAVLRAGAIGEATARAAGADWVAAVPVALGRWVGMSSLADIVAARGG
jgi:uncharacterized protein YciI